MATLSFVRKWASGRDAVAQEHGYRNATKRVIYCHAWLTGYQYLVFDSHEDARSFASASNDEYHGPNRKGKA